MAVQAHPESAKTAIDKLKKVWKLGAEMCGDLDNYAKGYALYHVAKEHAQGLLTYFSGS